jgi:hypothetical protein
VCESVVTPDKPRPVRTLEFKINDDFPENSVVPRVQTLPLYGYDAFPLGGVDTACFCGWAQSTDGRCVIPAAVCAHQKLTVCSYQPGSMESHILTQKMIDDWTVHGDWDCPENDLSDSWGIVPTDYATNWIKSEGDLTVSMGDVISFGLAGIRLGNLPTLSQQAKVQGVHPGT